MAKLEASSKSRADSVRHFRWFVWAALVWMFVQAVAGIVVTYLVFSTISYLDTARKARDGRDALEEYVACSDLADRAAQRPLTQREMQNFDLLNCRQALSLPVPGGVPGSSASPNPSQPSAGAPSPQVSLTPVPLNSGTGQAAAPQAMSTTPVPQATPSTPAATPTTPAPATSASSTVPTSNPTRECAVGLLGLCVLSGSN